MRVEDGEDEEDEESRELEQGPGVHRIQVGASGILSRPETSTCPAS